jgi:hypothetical protein
MAGYMSSKKTMEVNPENAIMDELRTSANATRRTKPDKDLVEGTLLNNNIQVCSSLVTEFLSDMFLFTSSMVTAVYLCLLDHMFEQSVNIIFSFGYCRPWIQGFVENVN